MNITEWILEINNGIRKQTLTYRGNNNIIITTSKNESEDGFSIKFPRHELEKFMEMIKDEQVK